MTDPLFGAGWTVRSLDLGEDDEGPLLASLVHREPDPSATATAARGGSADLPPILALHGWSDYVLDRALLDHLGELGHDVWGLDLRKYGRSLRPGQTPTEIEHLSRYDEEIGRALQIIGPDRPPVLLAHSTGGLTATLWAQRRPGTVHALALNSPWLEAHLGAMARHLAAGPVHLLARRLRRRPIMPPGSSHYARTTHAGADGEYDYDLQLKPPGGHPFPADTLAAVLDGQHRVELAGPLQLPVLVLHSSRTRIGAVFHDSMRRADSVLDVRTMAKAARRLGPHVRVAPIEGARHDVFLSEPDARRRAIDVLTAWLAEPGPLGAGPRTMTARDRSPGAEAVPDGRGVGDDDL